MLTSDFDPVNFGSITHERIKVRPMYYELGFSPFPHVFGRRIVLNKLLSALKHIPSNYGITVWDIYRPREVQKKLFDWMQGEIKKAHPTLTDEENFIETQKYMSLPAEVGDTYCSPHLSGGAIDLTLHDQKTGNEIDMGTLFDDCTERAHVDYFEQASDLDLHTITMRDNRRILKLAMESAGFTSYQYEWWHYDFGNVFWQKATKKKAMFDALFGELEWPVEVTN